MADVLTRDGDVTFKDQDVTFDHELLTLAIGDAYSSCLSETVSLEDVLFVNHSTQVNTAGAVTLFQENVLTVTDADQHNVTQGIALTLIGIDEVEPDPVWLDTEAAVFKDHADGVFYPHYLTTLELTDGIQQNVPSSVTLIAEGALAVASAYSKQVTDSVTLSEEITGVSFPVNDGENANVADVLTLSQDHLFAPVGACSTQTAAVVDLGVEYVLTVSDGIQAGVVETVSFFIAGIDDIAVNDTAQVQHADSCLLFQEYVLGVAVSDSYVINAADGFSLVDLDHLGVANAHSSQAADSVALSQQQHVAVTNSINANTSESPAVVQQQHLAPSETHVEQVADLISVNVESEDVLTVDSVAHSQLVDALVLIQSYVADTLDCAQNQYPETLELLILSALSVSGCQNKNFAQSVTLGFRSGFMGIAMDPYLISMTHQRAMESVTQHRYIMQ